MSEDKKQLTVYSAAAPNTLPPPRAFARASRPRFAHLRIGRARLARSHRVRATDKIAVESPRAPMCCSARIPHLRLSAQGAVTRGRRRSLPVSRREEGGAPRVHRWPKAHLLHTQGNNTSAAPTLSDSTTRSSWTERVTSSHGQRARPRRDVVQCQPGGGRRRGREKMSSTASRPSGQTEEQMVALGASEPRPRVRCGGEAAVTIHYDLGDARPASAGSGHRARTAG